MFKKILLIMSFCLLLFGTTAFADDSINRFIEQGKSRGQYYYTYINSRGYIQFYTSDKPFVIESDGSLGRNGIKCSAYRYNLNKLSQVWDSGTSVDDIVTLVVGNEILNTNYDVIDSRNGSVFFSPPRIPITEVVGQEMGTVLPLLLSQLKILLPVGVIILCLLLGVYLIPRLVHSFL